MQKYFRILKEIPNNDTFLISVQEFIDSEQLFNPNDRLLLGVSGGVDSTALVYAMVRLGYEVGLCHVNFLLRGIESDSDAAFVQSLGQSLNIAVYISNVDTKLLAVERKASIQEVARQTRYEYFEQIRQIEWYDYICTAHHLDDQIETVFFRWIKGSGLKGILGIPAVNERVRRPFLSQTKESVLAFCQKYQIDHREDASNESDKYDRNYIRHHLISPIARINPSYHQTFLHQNKVLKSTFDFYHAQVKAYWQNKIFYKNRLLYVDVSDLGRVSGGEAVLFELLSRFSFLSDPSMMVYADILSGKSGKLYLSPSHEVLLFRKLLCIRERAEDISMQEIIISSLQFPFVLDTECGRFTTESKHPSPTNQITLHSSMLPLTLRTWQIGDFFHPLGMKGKTKKLSDYFNDEGINRFERDQLILLCRDSHVLWVPGWRMDESLSRIKGATVLSYFPDDEEQKPINVFE